MGKAEEYLAKKRNKANRKRLHNTVDFAHGVQSAKRRRKAGRRRVCEGMCYTLPTPEDPFNDLYQKRLGKRKESKVQEYEQGDTPIRPKGHENGNSAKRCIDGLTSFCEQKKKRDVGHSKEGTAAVDFSGKGTKRLEQSKTNLGSVKISKKINKYNRVNSDSRLGKVNIAAFGENECGQNIPKNEKVTWRPIMRPIMKSCLKRNEIMTTAAVVIPEDAFEKSLCAVLNAGLLADLASIRFAEKKLKADKMKRMIASKWDWKFWEACGTGLDILGTGGAPGLLWPTDYVVAAATHIAGRQLQNGFCQNPIVLVILSSQEQTLRVRKICRLLKQALSIRSVSLHTGTPLQHQVEGLSTSLPEILVATPDRLCELLAVDAVSVSNVSFMVVDGLKDIMSCGFGELLHKIRLSVHLSAQTVVLSESFSHSASNVCRQVLKDPISRVVSDSSLVERSACITQAVSVFTSEEKRLQKLIKVLRQHFEKQQVAASCTGVVVLLRQPEFFQRIIAAIKAEGYTVGCFKGCEIDQQQPALSVLEHFRKGQVQVLLAMEDIVGQIDLAALSTVISYEFPSTIHTYCQILTGMACCTINGILHSFCSGSTAPLASQLGEVLLHCLQPIPPSLNMLAEAATLIEQKKLGQVS